MAVLRKWSVTSAVDVLVPLMHLRVDDDDETDIFIAYIDGGICFGSWGGVVKVNVTAPGNGCGNEYRVERKVVGSSGSITSAYNHKQLHEMIDDIYLYIQQNSRNGQ